MKVSEIIAKANTLTDEEVEAVTIVSFINDAMATIGVTVGATFPLLDVALAEQEPVIPDKWQRVLLIPFVAAKIKQMDASQFEYNDYFGQFQFALTQFKANYTVPDEYKDSDSSDSIEPSFDGNYFEGDW
jgi:hypothetical protein